MGEKKRHLIESREFTVYIVSKFHAALRGEKKTNICVHQRAYCTLQTLYYTMNAYHTCIYVYIANHRDKTRDIQPRVYIYTLFDFRPLWIYLIKLTWKHEA